jgi:glycosyltransferase involved in cell wall biosynthesis
MRILAAIPARNEEASIGSVLDHIALLYPSLPVVVINDSSTDRTSGIALSRSNVSVIDLPFWTGYGGALQTAYKYALREGYDAIIQLDADGQHDPVYIGDLLAQLEKTDIVIGSRFLNRADAYPMSVPRRLGCRTLSWIAKRLTGMDITDPTSGFQALNRKAMEIAVMDHYPMDYPDIDVLILMHRFHLKVAEVPVVMHVASEKSGMHEGLQVWYYGIKMLLSVFVVMLRKG